MIEFNLRLRNFAVRTARDAIEALALIQDWRPQVIILDVLMPKIDGFTLLPMIRRVTGAPVIMLTARSEVSDVVKGLESGADDYIGKPFEFAELIARLEAALRRPVLDRPETLAFADLRVDLQSYTVTRGDVRIALSAREFSVLTALLQHSGRVLSRDSIFDRVWGPESDADAGIVDRTISNLRAKVDQGFDKKLIQTIRGVGFSVRE